MLILGIETSCDDTAAAVVRSVNGRIKVLSSLVSSQTEIHAAWGGVVPNLAAREHLSNILPIIEESLKKAGVKLADLDLIAVTNGPGLIPCLLIGTSVGKSLAYLFQKPLLGIHHIEGHIYANFIGKKEGEIKFPILCLVVSGGHTQLILMKNHFAYKIVGQTLDDAAGEAFDKVARILNLGYPGGPAISDCAKNYKLKAKSYILPRPMLNSKDLNFSFSGLKTAVLYLVKKNPQKIKKMGFVREICLDFQQAVIDVLVEKTLRAACKYKPKTIMLAGGVSANQELRLQLGRAINKNLKHTLYQIPDPKYSIDNAAMIAAAGCYRFKKSTKRQKKLNLNGWKEIRSSANLSLQ